MGYWVIITLAGHMASTVETQYLKDIRGAGGRRRGHPGRSGLTFRI